MKQNVPVINMVKYALKYKKHSSSSFEDYTSCLFNWLNILRSSHDRQILEWERDTKRKTLYNELKPLFRANYANAKKNYDTELAEFIGRYLK
jgi:hypothetical protein